MDANLKTRTKAASTALDASVKGHSSQALIVQGYALSALQQPHVDLSGFERLKEHEAKINGGIDRAKGHSKRFLDQLLPEMIGQIGNIDAYFNIQNAIPKALNTSSDPNTALRFMKIAQERAEQYQADSAALVVKLQDLRGDLSGDAAKFKSFVAALNAAVDGDNGVLADTDKQLQSIDGKIAGAISGTVISGLAIFGGVVLIAVGSVGEIVTGGASTAAIVGGVALLAGGVGGEVASAVTLAKLLDLKSDLISKKARLKSEVSQASAMSSGFDSLSLQAGAAATATQQMANAWSGLGDHLGALITNLEQGRTDDAELRLLLQTAANDDVADIRKDVSTIQGQLTGARIVTDAKTPVARLVVDHARKLAA